MPENRKYRPGSKVSRFRIDGKMSQNRYAWLRTIVGQFVIMRYDDDDVNPIHLDSEDEPPDKEGGGTVRLVIPRTYGKPMMFNITALTHEELVQMRRFFDLLFELAEPVVLERDRVANEALGNGDDSFARVYRQVPQFVVRGRPSGPDGEGILDGPEDVPAGPSDEGDSTGGSGGSGGEVAVDNQEDRGSQDDDPSDDEPAGLRQMGGTGPDPE